MIKKNNNKKINKINNKFHQYMSSFSSSFEFVVDDENQNDDSSDDNNTIRIQASFSLPRVYFLILFGIAMIYRIRSKKSFNLSRCRRRRNYRLCCFHLVRILGSLVLKFKHLFEKIMTTRVVRRVDFRRGIHVMY